MKMQHTDVTVYGVHYDKPLREAMVVARAGTIGMDWPDTIQFDGVTYKYSNNEVMLDWIVEHWGGHARYIEIPKEING
jgi:hypothetical protein